MAVAAAMAIVAGADDNAAQSRYTITDLGTLGGSRSVAMAINASGQIVGNSVTADGKMRGFLYDSGSIEELPSFGGRDSFAYDISDLGTVVGRAQDPSGVFRAFLTSRGNSPLDLTRLNQPVDAPYSTATGVNKRGEVAGYHQSGNEHRVAQTRAFLVSDSMFSDLGAFNGHDAVVSAINDQGQLVGFYSTDPHADYSSYRAFHARPGSVAVDIGDLGGPITIPTAINQSGKIVGFGQLKNGEPRAFLYDGERLSSLGTLEGGRQSFAYGINARGDAVGASDATSSGLRAVLFTDGQIIDLNSMIPPDSGWVLIEARDINDSGAIVGAGVFRGEQRAYLLTPGGPK